MLSRRSSTGCPGAAQKLFRLALLSAPYGMGLSSWAERGQGIERTSGHMIVWDTDNLHAMELGIWKL